MADFPRCAVFICTIGLPLNILAACTYFFMLRTRLLNPAMVECSRGHGVRPDPSIQNNKVSLGSCVRSTVRATRNFWSRRPILGLPSAECAQKSEQPEGIRAGKGITVQMEPARRNNDRSNHLQVQNARYPKRAPIRTTERNISLRSAIYGPASLRRRGGGGGKSCREKEKGRGTNSTDGVAEEDKGAP